MRAWFTALGLCANMMQAKNWNPIIKHRVCDAVKKATFGPSLDHPLYLLAPHLHH